MPTIQEIIGKAKAYLPTLNVDRILRAYDFAYEAHKGQTRFSGEPYIIHPLWVAFLLLDFHPDEDSIVAALLHDVSEDTEKNLDDIERTFGLAVRSLCWGMQKLSKVRSKVNDPQVENLRKLFLAMAKDFRVVLLKLCDRLHNMKTLEFVRSEKQKRIAEETLDIYAPIAARLGIYRLKSQLEDLSFSYLSPEEYRSIQEQLIKTEKWREKYIEVVKQTLLETLSRDGIHGQMDGRVKSAYSIHRKLEKKNKNSLSDIFDVFAMRIILPDIYKYGKEYNGHLYVTLGILHNHFTPLAHRFKDYVAVPKVNGYRSLHTTVMGLGPKVHTQPTEVQIRTAAMHQYAEFGIAAHWLYEEKDRSHIPKTVEDAVVYHTRPFFQRQKEWISGLQKIGQENKSNQDFLEYLKTDIFQDRIFVLTPRGDVKDLPHAATPVDFAYAIHTDIGNHCAGAKVNGNMVPIDYELKSGEVVEIIVRKNIVPNQNWLSFVRTNHARNRIRGWFRDLDDHKHFRAGKNLLNEKLRQLGYPLLDVHLSILRQYGGKKRVMKEREEILRDIGKGLLLAYTVVRKVFNIEELFTRQAPLISSGTLHTERVSMPQETSRPRLSIGGEENLPFHFVKCCNASFSTKMIGYVTRGRGISVHKKDCSVLRNIPGKRFVPVRTIEESSPRYMLTLRVEAKDRVGLMSDVTKTIADCSINIRNVVQKNLQQGFCELEFTIELKDFDQFERVLAQLEKIRSVRRACRLN